ncbi:4-deoxy-L-threo-5-hexosulose-uronate ketol-isomerase [Bacillus atrophaeus]|nr:5-dehydro-4-deoxy-D-glucuronate isomerase [Bacillus atrophaeus]MDQ0928143.1 4-deoxy-L-threo-5-hexosulose-uronate ketol-isomerase [Bacillus atrophaeus]
MENRYSVHPEQVKRFTTEELRSHFLMESLFTENELTMFYSHEDRVVIGGAAPVKANIKLDAGDFLKTEFFLERREIGIINVGKPGVVKVGDEEYVLQTKDFLYIGMGHRDVSFSNLNGETAKFYFVSAGAHQQYPTQKAAISELTPAHLGGETASNVRDLYKVIHNDGIKSCQLMMGITVLEKNNNWNTMPAHVHDRRMEAYLYLDLNEDAKVFHFMGEPDETRHLVVGNEQAVLSPAWSIHSGAGTSNYSFVWAMAGENYTFTDMDLVPMNGLK